MNGKPPFHEDYVPKNASPLYTGTVEFPYDQLQGETPIMDDEDALAADKDKRLAEIIGKVFRWVTDCKLSGKRGQMMVGRRFIALAWVLNPVLFEGSPSACTLAKRLGIKSLDKRSGLVTLTSEASRQFGISNRAQQHAWNRGKVAPSSPTASPKGQAGHNAGSRKSKRLSGHSRGQGK